MFVTPVPMNSQLRKYADYYKLDINDFRDEDHLKRAIVLEHGESKKPFDVEAHKNHEDPENHEDPQNHEKRENREMKLYRLRDGKMRRRKSS